MSLLTEDNQKKFELLLVQEKVLNASELKTAKEKAVKDKKNLVVYLLDNNLVDNETLTHLSAMVSGVQYVNLLEATIDQTVLKLLSKDIAEHFMAVPLGEVQNRLAVAMLDANNVQAVDYLSSKIARPLKVYMASEEGIRHVLEQYHTDLQQGVSAAIGAAAKSAKEDAGQSRTNEDIKTIVQESPISRALSTILEY